MGKSSSRDIGMVPFAKSGSTHLRGVGVVVHAVMNTRIKSKARKGTHCLFDNRVRIRIGLYLLTNFDTCPIAGESLTDIEVDDLDSFLLLQEVTTWACGGQRPRAAL